MIQVKFNVSGQDIFVKIRPNHKEISNDIEFFIRVAELAVERILWDKLISKNENYTIDFYLEFNNLQETISEEFCIDWKKDIDMQLKVIVQRIKDKIALKAYRTIVSMLEFE